MPQPESTGDGGEQGDALDAMEHRAARRHRNVPPPKRPGGLSQGPVTLTVAPSTAEPPPAASEATAAPESASVPAGETSPEAAAAPPTPASQTPGQTPKTERRASARTPGRARARARRDRITWTADAKAVRSALVTYQAQLRRVEERADEARKLAKRVPQEDLAAIVQRVALDTGADAELLARAAGLRSLGTSVD